ncbi:MAG: MBL fold metallo-hydrolase [Candidatus Adiutrix sp.]|nr:MBL fold metallo-hydrolase [Candidatus Adiutrix sp.]
MSRPGAALESYQAGESTVLALADSRGERGMDVFSHENRALIEKYVPTGRTPSAVMAFAVRRGPEVMLIDAGLGQPEPGERQSRLPAGLAGAGLSPEQVTWLLLTHLHGDHLGGLIKGREKAFPKARVLVSRPEAEFWLSDLSLEKYPGRKANFDLARQAAELYGPSWETFEPGAEVAPGLTSVDLRGHTPGHSGFLLESGPARVLFWGDLMHAAALQFPCPELNADFDMDPDRSRAVRRAFLEKSAREGWLIAGAHLPFPAVGRVEKLPEGAFRFGPPAQVRTS